MKQELFNTFKIFSLMLGNEKIPRQQLIIPRYDLKIIRSFYDHYNNGKHKITYSQFLYTVVKMSIEQRVHYFKIAETVSKTINNING